MCVCECVCVCLCVCVCVCVCECARDNPVFHLVFKVPLKWFHFAVKNCVTADVSIRFCTHKE